MKEESLIEETDASVDADLERFWIEEAQRRYDAYLIGELEALPGNDVMNRARNALRGGVARPSGRAHVIV